MFSESNCRDNEAETRPPPQDFKGPSWPHSGDRPIRLSPLPARNMLLTILFFSALAAALLYWIFFPPAPQQTSDNSRSSNAESVERP